MEGKKVDSPGKKVKYLPLDRSDISIWGENHNICTNVRMSTPNENENTLFVKKINVNSSQMFIIYVNIISLLHYE